MTDLQAAGFLCDNIARAAVGLPSSDEMPQLADLSRDAGGQMILDSNGIPVMIPRVDAGQFNAYITAEAGCLEANRNSAPGR